jgi:beta-glucosidase
MDPTARDFPSGFLFGAATSAHQVEGGNDGCDWWAWEQRGGAREPSGGACDHYRRYPEDIALLKELGLGSYRFSVEWARVEPEEGRFDEAALRHYRDMVERCRELGVEPIVTFHHFTLPTWLSVRGGVLARDSSRLFARYCRAVAEALTGRVTWVVTINEPMVLVLMGYVQGLWPPGKRPASQVIKAARRLVSWHEEAFAAIREVDPAMRLGIAKHWIDFRPLDPGDPVHRLGRRLQHHLFNRWYLDRVKSHCDFIGINYYARQYTTGPLRQVPLASPDAPRTEMGWSIVPEGLRLALAEASGYGLPLIVTENGIACRDDDERIRYIDRHLAAVHEAIAAGADVRGYQYWSLLDNFEWAEGYRPKFGLVAVDLETQERTVRDSARHYGEIARQGRLPDPID